MGEGKAIVSGCPSWEHDRERNLLWGVFMQPTVPLVILPAAGRRAGASFMVSIAFFVVAVVVYATLLVLRDAWMIPGTRTMHPLSYYLVTVARALVPALFVGFGARFYALIEGARASALGATIFVIGIVWETVFPLIKDATGPGMFFGMLALAGLAAFGTSTVVAMAYFIPYFRKPAIWGILLLLWMGGGITPPAPVGYLFIAVRSFALAAVVYWLQRAGAIATKQLAAAFD